MNTFTKDDGLKLVFSASNINRSQSLPVKVKKVLSYKFVNAKVAVVVYITEDNHKCSRFFSYRTLAGVALEFRKNNGQKINDLGLVFKLSDTKFDVGSQSSDDEYRVTLGDKNIHECTCIDHQIGSELTKFWRCKHIYATLNYTSQFSKSLVS